MCKNLANHTSVQKSLQTLRLKEQGYGAFCPDELSLGFDRGFVLDALNLLCCSSIPVHFVSSYLETLSYVLRSLRCAV